MIGERVDVGDVRIADRDIDQVLVGMHVLRLAERHLHRRRVGRAGERDPLLRPQFAGRENERRGDQCRQRRCHRLRRVGAPVVLLLSARRHAPAMS